MVADLSDMFSAEDIGDFPRLIERLRSQSDPVSTFLWGQLSTEDQIELINYQPSAPGSKPSQTIVVNTLNKIVGGASIYTRERFKGFALRQQTVNLTVYDSHAGGPQTHLNRMLLEDAFPSEVSRNVKVGGTTINATTEVVLLIVFTNMSTNETYYVPTAHGIENDPRYSLLVITPSGKRLLPHGDPWCIRAESLDSLDPDKMRHRAFTFNLSAICKFDEIGSYTITATRQVDWPDGKQELFEVASNPLTIRIVTDK